MTTDGHRSALVFRVDARLVHSAIVNAWLPHIGATRLIIADAALSDDARRRTIARLSVPSDVCVVFSNEDDVKEIEEALADGMPTLVVFASLDAALRAREAGLTMPSLNVGHVPAGPGRVEICPSVCIGPHDIAAISALRALGVMVEVRPLPDDETLDFWTTHFDSISSARAVDVTPPEPIAGPASRTTASSAKAEKTSQCRVERVLVVGSERGLHLRVAHLLAQLVSSFDAHVQIGRDGRFVNAKSLLGLTTLGAARGTELRVIAEGLDALEVVDAIEHFFEAGFEEDRTRVVGARNP